MLTDQRRYVWSFNEQLPFLCENESTSLSQPYSVTDNAKFVLSQYHRFLERTSSSCLKSGINDVFNDLDVPIAIINVISEYVQGDIIYSYKKSFENIVHHNQVIYITPIILGYIETFLFFATYVLLSTWAKESVSPNSNDLTFLLLFHVLLLYGIILFIHAAGALICFYKCKQYETSIRNLKRYFYSDTSRTGINIANDVRDNAHVLGVNDNDNQSEQSEDIKKISLEDPEIDRDEQKISTPTLTMSDDTIDKCSNVTATHSNCNDDNKEKELFDRKINANDHDTYDNKHPLDIVLNPSNNSFAYVAYQ